MKRKMPQFLVNSFVFTILLTQACFAQQRDTTMLKRVMKKDFYIEISRKIEQKEDSVIRLDTTYRIVLNNDYRKKKRSFDTLYLTKKVYWWLCHMSVHVKPNTDNQLLTKEYGAIPLKRSEEPGFFMYSYQFLLDKVVILTKDEFEIFARDYYWDRLEYSKTLVK